jgi:hypothetical protein
LEAEHVVKGGAKTVVVETMGYADVIYRQRKMRTHAQMSVLCGGAPVIHHDFHQPGVAASRPVISDFGWIAAGQSRERMGLPDVEQR